MVPDDVVMSVLPPVLWLMKFCSRKEGQAHSNFQFPLGRGWHLKDSLGQKCCCIQKPECHSNSEGSVKPWSPFWIWREQNNLSFFTWASSEQPVLNRTQGLHALLPGPFSIHTMWRAQCGTCSMQYFNSVADILCSIVRPFSRIDSFSSALLQQLWYRNISLPRDMSATSTYCIYYRVFAVKSA